jgi:glycosyltransferase involved in cell wall biosynthesis
MTPEEPGGTRSYWISRELIKRGHRVVIITSTNNFKHPNAERVVIDGIDVVYVKNAYSQSFSPLRKIFSFLRFVLLSCKVASRQKDVDLVFATSTPLTVGFVALYLKTVKKWRYVFEVRDLWPEFPIQMGAIRNKLVIKLLRKFERRIYRKAEYIIALSPGMMDGVLACGTPKSKVSVIPNMSKPDKFYLRERSAEVMKEYHIDGNKLNVVHFGAMGVTNGLEYVINTAALLQQQGNLSIHFLIVGNGSALPALKKQTEELKLRNVSFPGQFSMAALSELVNCCDVSLVSFKNLPILYTNSPNKLFDSLSAGKPIIVNSAGWTKMLVEEHRCGFYVDPESPADFAEKLLHYKGQKELLAEWGRNARRLSVEVFDKSILSAQVADVLEKVC